jgi:hypothetical protein
MIHSFDVEQAEKYGVGEAILIQNLIFWIEKNRANRKHYHDGRTWTYNSVQAFSELFPYYSGKQIRKIIENLIEAGVIRKGFWSDNLADRSTWYAFENESEFLSEPICPTGQDHLPHRASHLPHRASHIKEQIINTDSKPDSNIINVPKSAPRKRFEKPSLNEVQDFMATLGHSEHAEEFHDFYESKGWLVGRSPMKDWKAAARRWVRTSSQYRNSSKRETPEEMSKRKLREAGIIS